MIEIICALIAAIGAIVAAYLTILNKKDISIWKTLIEKTNSKRVNDIAVIYGELWGLLHNLNADRVYIIQPHPLINYLYISIGLEVTRKGVNKISYNIKNLNMSEVAHFCGQMVKDDFMHFKDIETSCIDKRAKAIFSTNGTRQLAIKKLVDVNDNWIGSLCLDSMSEDGLDLDGNRAYLADTANNIQYILPEYKEVVR